METGKHAVGITNTEKLNYRILSMNSDGGRALFFLNLLCLAGLGRISVVSISQEPYKIIKPSISVMQRTRLLANKSFRPDSHRCRQNPVCSSHVLCHIFTGMKAMCQVATWRKNHLRTCKYMSKLCLCFCCNSKCWICYRGCKPQRSPPHAVLSLVLETLSAEAFQQEL